MPQPESPRIRIVLVHLSTRGVRSPFLQNFAHECGRRGLALRIVTLSPDEHDHVEPLAPGCEHWRVGMPERCLLGRRMARLLKLWRFFRRLCSVTREWRPAVLMGTWGGGFALATLLRRFLARDAKLIFRAHEFIRAEDIGPPNPMHCLRPLYRYERRVARKADLVIIPDPIRARYQAPYLRISDPMIIRNTSLLRAETREDSPLAERVRAIRAEHPDAVLLAHAGTISAGTRIPSLIDSAPNWPENVLCLLMGEAPDEIRQRIEEDENARRHFRLLGFHPYPDIQPALSEVDVGLAFYASDWINERYCAPAKLCEYFRAGIAVLTSSQETLKAVVDEQGVGMATDPDDPQRLASDITRMTVSLEALSEMGRRAHALHEADWNFEKQSEPLFEWLEEALPKGA